MMIMFLGHVISGPAFLLLWAALLVGKTYKLHLVLPDKGLVVIYLPETLA